ncbi:hypothetical protein [Bdellovibrio bacteriovorus]|uniref:hypothetical protein n=1 Tax=Bdellovibrio bacteriovorus TaxID=959 RepID=UPI0035A6E61B
MEINKEQIWNAIVQNNDVIMKSLKSASDDHSTEFKSARDRVITAALQINSLFLTGWIALLSVGKLNMDCEGLFNVVLFIGCGLHVLVFALVVRSQWNTLWLHFRSQERTAEFETVVRTSFQKKREFVAGISDSDNISSVLFELSELDKPVADFSKSYSSAYNAENGTAWSYGKWAVRVFFASMVFSLISFIMLIEP